MLLSVIRLILKTSLVTPDFFTFLNYFYHFLPAVKVLKKSVRGNFWVRMSLTEKSFCLAVPTSVLKNVAASLDAGLDEARQVR